MTHIPLAPTGICLCLPARLLCRSGVRNVTCRFREMAMADSSSQASQLPDWALCTSPKTFSDLREGRYGLTLRAADNTGSIIQVRAGQAWARWRLNCG